MSDPISVLEATYCLEGTEEEWLTRVTESALPVLGRGHGIYAYTYEVTDPNRSRLRATAVCGPFDRSLLADAPALAVPPSDENLIVPMFRMGFVGRLRQYPSLLRRIGMGEERVRRHEQVLETILGTRNLVDQFWVNAQDPTHIGCCLIAPSSDRKQWQPREAQRWLCIAAHIATAFRIRRQLDSVQSAIRPTETTLAEAILRPTGEIDHAKSVAKEKSARSALRNAVRAMDKARGPARRSDPARALAVWEALVAGRWSLLDHFESDGRRYVVAHRNDPRVPDIRGLSLRERQVVAYTALGHSNKLIAYELGLSLSTVATHLTRARAKLGLPSGRTFLRGLG